MLGWGDFDNSSSDGRVYYHYVRRHAAVTTRCYVFQDEDCDKDAEGDRSSTTVMISIQLRLRHSEDLSRTYSKPMCKGLYGLYSVATGWGVVIGGFISGDRHRTSLVKLLGPEAPTRLLPPGLW